jgi:hypothetical protein
VVDAVDKQIEEAVIRVERIMSVAEQNAEPMAAEERAAIVVAQEESREAHLEEDATTGDRSPRGDGSRRASGCSG